MKRFLIWMFVIIGILVIADNIWSFVHYRKYYSGKKFTREGWEAAGKEMSNINKPLSEIMYGLNDRCKMFDDLTRNHLKKGMKLREVEELLGAVNKRVVHYCIGKKIKCVAYSMDTCYVSSWTISLGSVGICFNDKQEVMKFGKGYLNNKLCDKGEIVCSPIRTKCECYINDKLNGEECDFEVDRW